MSDTLIIDRDALQAKQRPAEFDDQTRLVPLPVETRRQPLGWYDSGEPTEIGLPPSRLGFAFLTQPEAEPESEPPRRATPVRRIVRRVHEEFSRTPRSMRLAFFAVPLLGAMIVLNRRELPAEATPVDPAHGAIVAAPSAAVAPEPKATNTAEITGIPASAPARAALPLSSVGARGRTLEARAADLVERGHVLEAAALYEDLARRHPDRLVFADAARILRRAARERTLEAR